MVGWAAVAPALSSDAESRSVTAAVSGVVAAAADARGAVPAVFAAASARLAGASGVEAARVASMMSGASPIGEGAAALVVARLRGVVALGAAPDPAAVVRVDGVRVDGVRAGVVRGAEVFAAGVFAAGVFAAGAFPAGVRLAGAAFGAEVPDEAPVSLAVDASGAGASCCSGRSSDGGCGVLIRVLPKP